MARRKGLIAQMIDARKQAKKLEAQAEARWPLSGDVVKIINYKAGTTKCEKQCQVSATADNRTAGQRPYRPVLTTIANSGFKSLAEVAYSEIVVYVRPPSLHDAEGEMRDTCALDHPGAFQLDRLGALVEQPDAIPQ